MYRMKIWVLLVLFSIVAFAVAACSGTTPATSLSEAEPTRTAGPTPTAQSGLGPTTTVAPSPTPTPRLAYPGFDFEVGEGAFWEYQWSYTDRSCAQGSGCSTKKDEGRFQVMLGPPREIQGITAYEIRLAGKHQVALSGANRDFAPRWRYLAVSDNRILGSRGSGFSVIFDGKLGKWAGSGYFTDRFSADELIEARPSNITEELAIAVWPGVQTGPAIAISRASSQSICETIAGVRVCPREESFNISERELYREGIGPVAYLFQSSFSFSGGNFFSSYQTTENVGLVASSLRGDSPSSPDELSAWERVESEPNDSLQQAHRLSLPATVTGDILHTDGRAQLRFYEHDVGQWLFIQLHDIYRFTLSERQQVTITLSSEGGTSADLNLLLVTLSEVNDEDTIFIDDQGAELVDFTTTNDPIETITVTLDPGEYYVAIQAFVTPARTDYELTVE